MSTGRNPCGSAVRPAPLTTASVRRVMINSLPPCYYKLVALVRRMLELQRKLADASIPADKKLCQRQIEATDRQIDAMVYDLYDLTEEEIAVVEDAIR